MNTFLMNYVNLFQGAAKKLAGSKLSLSAVGNLATVPYLDTL
jgi:hypothetical protein